MREAVSPSLIDVDPTMSIPGMLRERLRRSPTSTFIEQKSALGSTWTAMSVAEFADQVLAVAKGIVAKGIEPGDRVAIMSRTRYEWTLLDFAVWAAGAVPVPIYETSAAEQVRWIAADSGVRLALVETAAHAAVAHQARADLPEFAEVLVIDQGAIDELIEAGRPIADSEIDRRSSIAGMADLATVIYTSGTTGNPKGAELTHGNFVSLALEGTAGLPEVVGPGRRTLLFMPLAHVFARYIQVLCVPSGTVLGHSPDTKNLLPDLQSFRPTFLLAVPRVFEKVYNSAEQKAAASPAKLKLFRWAAKTSIVYSRALDTADGPSPALRAQHKVADTLVLGKLRAALGGAATFAISGGAPLGERLGHFYHGLGLQVLEGYGLTETSAATTVNMPVRSKIGTVGPPFPGAAIRIAEDGEIEVSGAHVFRGYRNNPEATAQAMVDGWFRTGDVGALDEDGYLTITGRKKEIIVTAGGKNVAPALLEDRLRGHPLVSQVVVVGDGQPFIAALVTLDAEMLPGWLASHHLPPMDVASAARSNAVLAALDRAVERTNEAVSRAESIRKIKVLGMDFSEANGYLTPSLKVKRGQVLRDFAAEVEELYSTR